jgi:Leucine-rich repeat (LRR) protein
MSACGVLFALAPLRATRIAEWRDLGVVTIVFFAHARTQGTIPSSIAGLKSLQWLGLDDNQLSGTIPGGIANMRTLNFMYVEPVVCQHADHNLTAGTHVSEPRAAELAPCSNLGSNLLTGAIPDLTGLTGLTALCVAPRTS